MKCDSSNYLVNKQCQKVVSPTEFCEKYNSTQICEQCSSGYALAFEKCEQGNIPNCENYLSTESCLKCKENFYVFQGKCQIYSSGLNCEKFHPDEDSCETCLEDHWMAEDSFFCTQNSLVSNCRKYSQTQDKCHTCKENKYLFENQCKEITSEKQVLNCKYYTDSAECEQCQDFHYLLNNQCVSGDNKCKEYYSQNVCKTCPSQFYLNSEYQCKEHSQGLNCLTFNPLKNECLTCPGNFHLNGNNQCQEISNCLVKNGHSCEECSPSHYLDSGFCKIRNAQNCKEGVKDKDECLSCQAKYWIPPLGESPRICKTLTPIHGCVSYTADKDACKICIPETYLSGGKCVNITKTLENCLAYEDAMTCQICKENFILSGNECFPGNISGCANYENINSCKTCYDNFYLESSHCYKYKADLHCETFHPNKNECIDCLMFHSKNQDNQCILIQGCDEFAENKHDCVTCKPNFFMFESKCKQRGNIECKTFLPSEDKCDSCEEDRWLDVIDGLCKEYSLVEGCVEYHSDQDFCSLCQENRHLQGETPNMKCPLNPVDNCETHSSDGICEKCRDSFVLDNNMCLAGELIGCLKYLSPLKCEKCESAFYLTSSSCSSYSSGLNCKTFDPSQDACTSCNSHFILSPSRACEPILG